MTLKLFFAETRTVSLTTSLRLSNAISRTFHVHLHKKFAYFNAFEVESTKSYGVADRCISDEIELNTARLIN